MNIGESSERRSGKDALKNLPLKDVVLDFEGALEKLSRRSRDSASDNIRELRDLQSLEIDNPFRSEAVDYFEKMLNTMDEWYEPGGFSFTEAELDLFYQHYGNTSFEGAVESFVRDMFPPLLDGNRIYRKPECICVGYLLDLVEIIDPAVAAYEERIEVLTEAVRNSGFDNYDLGSLFDDAVQMRGTGYVPYEVLLDRDEVINFRDLYVKNLSIGERDRFVQGYNANQINFFNEFGFSEN